MNLFRIICGARSYSVLPQGIATAAFELGRENYEDTIRIKNIKSLNLAGQSFCNELKFICDIHAEEIFEAADLAKAEIEKLLDQFALIIGSPIHEVKIIKGYDITPSLKDRIYVQFYHDVLDKIGSKSTSIISIYQVIKGITSANSDRIYRATHWYRKSLNESDQLDRFVSLWVGLETLNPIFQEMFPNENEIKKCKKCGNEIKNKGTSALKAFFREKFNDEKLYSKAREMRQVLHGYKDLVDVYNEALEINPLLTMAFRSAICEAAGVDPNLLTYKINAFESEQISFLFIANLSNLNINETSPDFEEPNFSLDIQIESKNNHLVFRPTMTTTVTNKGVEIGGMSWELMGDTGYPFDKIQIELKC